MRTINFTKHHPEVIQYLLTHDNSDEMTSPGDVNVLAKPLFDDYVYQLENGEYQSGKVFRGQDQVDSRLFLNLPLTAQQIFAVSK